MKNLIVITTAIVLLSACKKQPTVYTNPDNPTNYVLKKLTFASSDDSEIYICNYDAAYRLQRIDWSKWQQGSNNGTASFSFDYAGNLCTKITYAYSSNPYIYAYNYTYNGNRQLTWCSVSGLSIYDYRYYGYDGAGSMNTLTDSSGNGLAQTTYTYDTNKNLATQPHYYGGHNGPQYSKTIFYAYDDKVNFMKTINGIPPDFTLQYYTDFTFNLLSTNNISSFTSYSLASLAGPAYDSLSSNYSYEYTAAGLPAKVTNRDAKALFEYEKFR